MGDEILKIFGCALLALSIGWGGFLLLAGFWLWHWKVFIP